MTDVSSPHAFELHVFRARPENGGMDMCSITLPDGRRSKPVPLSPVMSDALRNMMDKAVAQVEFGK